MEYVEADKALFNSVGTRFDGVFTKLHVLGLTDYTNVLMLDLDVAVLGCLDELFALRAPAALHRSVFGAVPGSRIDGRQFFSCDSNQAYEWGQSGGINAGVMLLAPDEELYQRILKEVRMPTHPSHIAGSGPEQDYLSRLFAPWWRHIGVNYNYQIHRVFHALEGQLHSITANGIDDPARADDATAFQDTSWYNQA